MFDQIIENIKGQIGQSIQGQLPEGINSSDFANVAGDSLLEQLKTSAGSGDFSGIMEMFSGKETGADNPVLSSISPGLIQDISGKLGIDSTVVSGLVEKFLPGIMNMFNNQAGQGGFDIGQIISQFTGGNGISDIISQFTGDNKSGGSGGGLFDKIKGLFG